MRKFKLRRRVGTEKRACSESWLALNQPTLMRDIKWVTFLQPLNHVCNTLQQCTIGFGANWREPECVLGMCRLAFANPPQDI